MYGMIHKAAREFATQSLGDEAWSEVVERVGLGNEHFISGQHYSDEVTLKLIAELCGKLDMELADLLKAFGHYWIGFTERSDYSPALAMAGDDLETFLHNLDDLHHGIKATMPEADLPSFSVVRSDERQIEVLYSSGRDGLASFVEGLLNGLMDKFSEPGSVSHRSDGDGILFTINRAQAKAA